MSKNFIALDSVLADIISKATTAREMLKAASTEQVEEVEASITLEDVRKLLTQKSRDGKTAEVKALLLKHNANKLSEVNPSDYKSLMTEAEEL